MLRKLSLCLFVCLFLAGCSFYRIDSEDTTLDFYPPKDVSDGVVYLEKVDKPHEVIGIVTVDAERSKPFDEIVAKMKSEAAVLGGDAITDVRDTAGDSVGSGSPALLRNAYVRTRYTAKVVVFK